MFSVSKTEKLVFDGRKHPPVPTSVAVDTERVEDVKFEVPRHRAR